jgi:predicted  nucleic acid-binding Zn-ribbon protein
MAAKTVDLNIKTTADTTGLKQATVATDGLTTATNKANTATTSNTASASKFGGVSKQTASQIQSMASNIDLGDSAAAKMGESLMTLSGNLGVLGMSLSAGIGLGKLIGDEFYKIAHASEDISDKIGDMSKKLEAAYSDKAKQNVKAFEDSLKTTQTLTENVRTAELGLYEARTLQAESNARLIGSNLALDVAGINYLKTIGLVVDEEKALLAVRNEAAAKTTEAAVAAENAKIENARAKYNAATAEYGDVQDQVATAEKRLAELEQRQQQAAAWMRAGKASDKLAVTEDRQKEGFVSSDTKAFTAELEMIKTEIDGVYEVIKSGPARLEKITNDSVVQAQALDNAITASEIAISEITQKADLTARTAELTAATTQITTDAKEITAQIAKVEAITPLQQEAKAQITQAASDGVITAQDQIKIGQNLNVLQNSLKTGQVESLTTIRSLIEVNNQMAIKMSAMSQQIKSIQSKVQNIK